MRRSLAIDILDLKALDALTADGRITWADLASRLGLSAPAAADRVRRLEERGIIRGFTAVVAPASVGCLLTAFVAVTLDRPRDRIPFLQRVQALDEVQECHHVAGDDDYLLKVFCRDARHLDRIISDQLKSLDGVVKTRTTIVLDTAKEAVRVPLLSAGVGVDPGSADTSSR